MLLFPIFRKNCGKNGRKIKELKKAFGVACFLFITWTNMPLANPSSLASTFPIFLLKIENKVGKKEKKLSRIVYLRKLKQNRWRRLDSMAKKVKWKVFSKLDQILWKKKFSRKKTKLVELLDDALSYFWFEYFIFIWSWFWKLRISSNNPLKT